ncbi:50S ribosomal protein L30 [Bifidobacterium gallicum]|uniref:Large ribosomal subunit protein uL30 n=1 Tax=Bifidobacterium gallicum DSM 20093 = LMG 11596 TaxID=561180 RepID=D1NVB9_9BIFI|nr:50S ribosomal protein L30 [Bifidobacterium gallicum]EFA22770.1 ribosomal protein L30 [Bifidobacterium gallicum DSM 20093 = LMG 11596]KFI59712.1 50S ribosomal protein L30 [Bifidobacterium gallicum DSM 20093 = LMG 11596]
MAKLKITLVHGVCGANPKQRATVQTLALRKIGQSTIREDNSQTRGLIQVVRHLVTVEEAD